MNFKRYTFSALVVTIFTGSLYGQQYKGNVGINTNDPKTNLDIRGDVKLNPELYKTGDISQLYRIITDGTPAGMHEVVVKDNKSEEYKPFYEFDVEIPIKDNTKTNVDNFDTHIPANKFIVTVINSNFLQEVDGQPAAIEHVNKGLSGSGDLNGNPVKQVDAWIQGGTWHLSAMYRSAFSVTVTGNRLWRISLLAMNTDDAIIVDPNPNYKPDKVNIDPFAHDFKPGKAVTSGDQTGRAYDKYDNSNPQNPLPNEPQSLRGDSFKLNSGMNGGAKVNPLAKY